MIIILECKNNCIRNFRIRFTSSYIAKELFSKDNALSLFFGCK